MATKFRKISSLAENHIFWMELLTVTLYFQDNQITKNYECWSWEYFIYSHNVFEKQWVREG